MAALRVRFASWSLVLLRLTYLTAAHLFAALRRLRLLVRPDTILR
ncbi:hypothetical protein OG698_09590 [Streptomyces sp. NBC_01003]|nr:hypothetical protein OG698_09590 [Streptomyces sp. NBC_01003]